MKRANDIHKFVEKMVQEEICSLSIGHCDLEKQSYNSDNENVKVLLTHDPEKYLVQLLRKSYFKWFELVLQAKLHAEAESHSCENICCRKVILIGQGIVS